jgi:uncharacterized protein with PIN domain
MASAATPGSPPPRFACDGSLGALARWLRAAGYEAASHPGVGGEQLARAARDAETVLLTSDRRVFERRDVREGTVRALHVPCSLARDAQLAHVLRALGLGLRPPRCMGCGGPLVTIDKEAVRPRIPPRTAAWQDEYFLCRGCGQLFWRGTHWERIRTRLSAAAEP